MIEAMPTSAKEEGTGQLAEWLPSARSLAQVGCLSARFGKVCRVRTTIIAPDGERRPLAGRADNLECPLFL